METDKDGSKVLGIMYLVLAVLLALVLAVNLSWVARQVPWSWEKKLGSLISLPGADNPCSSEPLAKLLGRLYPLMDGDDQFPIHVQMIKDTDVNAYASFGGEIYLLSGLIDKAESADELAGVLAHEIEHVKRRHLIKGVFSEVFVLTGMYLFGMSDTSASTLGLKLVKLRFSREQELEADRGGLERLQKAQISPDGLKKFFERMGKESIVPEMISDHPGDEQRAKLAEKYKVERPLPVLEEEDWRRLRLACI